MYPDLLPFWSRFEEWSYLASFLKELGAPVENIILPTFAYEHKIFIGLFSRNFLVPIHVMGGIKAVELAPEFATLVLWDFLCQKLEGWGYVYPWADEIEQKVLSSPDVGNVDCTYNESNFIWMNHDSNKYVMDYFRNWTVCWRSFLSQAFKNTTGNRCCNFCPKKATWMY